MSQSPMQDPEVKRGALRWLLRETLGNLFLIAILFGLAGTWRWPMGWAFSATYILWSAASAYFIMPKNPEMLAERSRPKPGTKRWDVVILSIFGLLTLVEYVVAGLDFRFSWTQSFPLWAQWAGLLVAFLANDVLIVWSMVENAFFIATVRIQEERGQQVVSTGPYAVIRHPGYAATILLYIAAPFVLNSAWALIPAALSLLLLIVRTALEDRTLQAELPGYKDYAARVRYRLLPGVW